MAVETERKFRVRNDDWKSSVIRRRCLRQAYLTDSGRMSVRVRLDGTEAAVLTIKTSITEMQRNEYEYPIPVADAEALVAQCDDRIVAKVRHVVLHGSLKWEVDVFEGANDGLVIAEIELDAADQPFERPNWLGDEVTGDRRFYNSELAKHPFRNW